MTFKITHLAACATLGAVAGFFATGDAQAGCKAENNYIGDVCITAAPNCPENTFAANGSLVSKSMFSDLFTVIGYTYGKGDNGEMFGLPDLSARAPIGVGTYKPAPYEGGHEGLVVGTKLGKLRFNQTSDQLAYHTHGATISEPPSGGEATQAAPTKKMAIPGAPATASSDISMEQQPPTITVSPAGHSADTYIVAPRLTLNYCIVVLGSDVPR